MDTAKKKYFLGFGKPAGNCLMVWELLAGQTSAAGLQADSYSTADAVTSPQCYTDNTHRQQQQWCSPMNMW